MLVKPPPNDRQAFFFGVPYTIFPFTPHKGGGLTDSEKLFTTKAVLKKQGEHGLVSRILSASYMDWFLTSVLKVLFFVFHCKYHT